MDNPDVHSALIMLKAHIARTDWDGELSQLYALMKLLGIDDIPDPDLPAENDEEPDTDSIESDEY
jgi:hypothetical protein